ncbi:MAG: serine hydrolase domain-containing protein [Pseudomonadota bacterium]
MLKENKKIKDLMRAGVREGVYPGAVLLIARNGTIVFFEEAGSLSLLPRKIPMKKDTIFDLASLTKSLATTLALMKLADEKIVALDQPLADLLQGSPLGVKEALTPRLIMNHCAGFADWKPFYLELMRYKPEERKTELGKRIIEEPLAYPPMKGFLYSDLGFVILERVIEAATGMTMARFLANTFYQTLLLKRTFVGGKSASFGFDKGVFAATEDCPWRKRVLQGEVHDENAFAVGGYSGHAGLFGIVEEVYRIMNLLREHYQGQRDDFFNPGTVREFFRRQNMVQGCTWALGWDTPSEKNSSAGRYFSPESVGHLGFTGTSIWMDLGKDVMVVFFTNRVHPTRRNDKIKAFRPLLHDTIMIELCLNA